MYYGKFVLKRTTIADEGAPAVVNGRIPRGFFYFQKCFSIPRTVPWGREARSMHPGRKFEGCAKKFIGMIYQHQYAVYNF